MQDQKELISVLIGSAICHTSVKIIDLKNIPFQVVIVKQHFLRSS